MARKTLLTESEIRQFMKLANIKPIQEMGGSYGMSPGMRDDEDEDPPGMRDMREEEEADMEIWKWIWSPQMTWIWGPQMTWIWGPQMTWIWNQ
jgi:hypothetical protein